MSTIAEREDRRLDALTTEVIACRTCGLPHQLADAKEGDAAYCVRCGARLADLHSCAARHTAALALAALFLYVPANLLPVLHLQQNGARSDATVMGSVRLLAEGGNYFVAGIVFLASIVIPPLKLVGLLYLGISTMVGAAHAPCLRSRLYRWIELIGKWAMLDVFVLAVMVAAVKLGELAVVSAGPGALPFALCVVLTLAATESFDPHVMWKRKAGARDGG